MINKIIQILDAIITIFCLIGPFVTAYFVYTRYDLFSTVFSLSSDDKQFFVFLVLGISFSCFFSLFSFCCLINVLIRKVISRIKANQ